MFDVKETPVLIKRIQFRGVSLYIVVFFCYIELLFFRTF